eukprot:TRINITY_DN113034_c0_g1_i1.p1 TRINITY_DN113034_c0_g1~~TRINITY_DN113034_c0_g1_i1.p1  ORF type:complete len:524 (-),score=69.81 TRINITY_DN113034_c0_g1_i1:893-2464(-)
MKLETRDEQIERLRNLIQNCRERIAFDQYEDVAAVDAERVALEIAAAKTYEDQLMNAQLRQIERKEGVRLFLQSQKMLDEERRRLGTHKSHLDQLARQQLEREKNAAAKLERQKLEQDAKFVLQVEKNKLLNNRDKMTSDFHHNQLRTALNRYNTDMDDYVYNATTPPLDDRDMSPRHGYPSQEAMSALHNTPPFSRYPPSPPSPGSNSSYPISPSSHSLDMVDLLRANSLSHKTREAYGHNAATPRARGRDRARRSRSQPTGARQPHQPHNPLVLLPNPPDMFVEDMEYDNEAMTDYNTNTNDPTLLVVMNVDFGNGIADVINIHHNDDPIQLAEEFCQKHQLPPDIIPTLANQVDAHLQQALQGLYGSTAGESTVMDSLDSTTADDDEYTEDASQHQRGYTYQPPSSPRTPSSFVGSSRQSADQSPLHDFNPMQPPQHKVTTPRRRNRKPNFQPQINPISQKIMHRKKQDLHTMFPSLSDNVFDRLFPHSEVNLWAIEMNSYLDKHVGNAARGRRNPPQKK